MNETEKILGTLKTKNGGYTRETLNKLGVSWPPAKGWQKKLIRENSLGEKKEETYVQDTLLQRE